MDILFIIRIFGYKFKTMRTTATIQDLKDWSKIITDRVKESGGSYCDRIEKVLYENYDNIYIIDGIYTIRLYNGTFKSIYDYV